MAKPDLPSSSSSPAHQLHVSAQPEILRERYARRAHRHPVHYNEALVDEVPARAAAGEWTALELPGSLVRIDTTTFPDVDALVAELAGLCGTALA